MIGLIWFDHELNQLSGKHVLNKVNRAELCKRPALTCGLGTGEIADPYR